MTEKEIREHVKNVDDTIKITRAMQVIATTKVFSRQQRKENAFKYLSIVERMASLASDFEKPTAKWFKEGKSDVSAYIVISGDKGLCGDYNISLLSFAAEQIEKSKKVKLFLVGHMGIEFFKDLDGDVNTDFVYHQFNPSPIDSRDMTKHVLKEFFKGEFKDLYVIYTDVSKYGDTNNPICKKILPIEYSPAKEQNLQVGEDRQAIFAELVFAKIYSAVMSASLAVNFKRMSAMRQATSNGEEMIEDLRLQLNKSRQEKITNELIDAIAVTFGKRV